MAQVGSSITITPNLVKECIITLVNTIRRFETNTGLSNIHYAGSGKSDSGPFRISLTPRPLFEFAESLQWSCFEDLSVH